MPMTSRDRLDYMRDRLRAPSPVTAPKTSPTPHVRTVVKPQSIRGFAKVNAEKSACSNGHPFDKPNTYFEGSHRKCKKCLRENRVRHNEKLAAARQNRLPKPSKEVLVADLAEHSYLRLALKYGVSDVAIRKWARGYGLLAPAPAPENSP